VKSPTEWIKLNAGQTGLFRVRYSNSLLKNLADNLFSLSDRDRTGLVNDAFAFAISGKSSIVEYLVLLTKYTQEINDTVWTDILTNLSTIRKLFSHPALDKYIITLVSTLGKELGWEAKPGESESRSTLRGLVMAILGSCGDPAVLEEAKNRWKKFLNDKNSLVADLQGAVFMLAVLGGGEEEINQMIQVYKSASLPAQKITALRCIGYSRNPDLIKKGVEYMMTEEVRMQDRFFLLSALASSSVGREFCWEFVKHHWKEFEEKFSHNLLPRVISLTCENFNTIEKAKDVEAYFSVKKVSGTERTIAQTIEAITSNSSIYQRNLEPLSKFLASF